MSGFIHSSPHADVARRGVSKGSAHVKRRLVAAACALVAAIGLGRTTAQAQIARRNVTLQGVVRDSATGEVLPHARVELVDLRRGVESNLDGRFTLVSVPTGAHQLSVQYIGYRLLLRSITVDTSNTMLTIALPRAVVRLAEAQVKADADQRGAVASIGQLPGQMSISTAQVEAMPSLGEADVFRTLQMLPSVAGAGNGTASLSVRGGTSDQNLVLLDGMTVYHVDHFFGLFSAFNTDALKDIQLYAGGFPARYGGRVSSVLDLTGKAGDEHQFRASGAANLLSGRFVVEVPLGKGSWLISGRRSYTDVIRSGLYGSLFNFAKSQGTAAAAPTPRVGRFGNQFQTTTVDPSFYFYDFNSKLTYRPSQKDVVALSIYSGLDNLDQSQALPTGPGRPGAPTTTTTTSTLDDITTWGNTGASARWFRQWGGRFSSDALVASSRYTSDGNRTANGGLPNGGPTFNFGFTETNTVNDVSARLDNALQPAAWSRIEFGTWITKNTVTYNFAVGTDTTQRNRNTSRNGTSLLSAFYLQHTWSPTSAIDLTTGVRSNTYDATNTTYTEPRFSVGWQATPSLRLKGAIGQYHQFVNRVENEDVLQGSRDFWLLADTVLKPTSAQHRVVGATYDRPGWALNVEAYDKTLDHLALFSRRYRRAFGVNTGSFFYSGDGTAKGLEFLLEKKRGALTGWAAYTLAKSTSTFANVDNGQEFPTSLDQRHELKGFGQWTLGKWEVAATGIYGSGRPYTAPISQYNLKLLDGTSQTYINVGDKNSERLASYQRMDLSFTRLFHTEGTFDWRVGVSLYNLANRRNVSFRKFDLSTSPMTISDVTQLGFTPSIDVKLTLRDLKERALRKENR